MQHGIAIAIAFPMTILFYLLYQWKKITSEKALALTFKGAATLCCAGLAIYGSVIFPGAGNWLLAAGLLVCVAADVMLRIKFLAGMACFALGHVCYCIAYFLFVPPTFVSLVVFLIAEGLALSMIPWAKKRRKEMNAAPFIGYGLVLSAMLAFASVQKPALLAGAILFVISDWMLGYRLASKNTARPYDYVCLGCYYLGQFLIGASTLL